MTSSFTGGPGDDRTKVMYQKTDHADDTVILPGRAVHASNDGTDAAASAVGAATDATVFVPTGIDRAPPGSEFDPVVGWLVVVKGPGRGNSLEVCGGQSSIGRGADLRITVDFGDAQISRDAHAFIICDLKNNKFFVKSNDQRTLVYLNGAPLTNTVDLRDRDVIAIGDTHLLFVALCDDKFDWSANDEPDPA